MGASGIKTLQRIKWLTSEGHLPLRGRIAELGTQQLRASEEEIADFFGLLSQPRTRIMDLNIHFVPDDLLGQSDLVTNYGTTEHVLNQMLAMRSIHDLAKPGGLIHHDLPMGGYPSRQLTL